MKDSINNRSLVLDLVEWVAGEPRPYTEVMAAWRTSCPRLTVWEDTLDYGFVTRTFSAAAGQMVEVTSAGTAFLAAEGRA